MTRWYQTNAIGAAATALLVIVLGCAVHPAERSASPIPTSSLAAATAGDEGEPDAPTATPPSSTAPPALTPAATPLASVTSGPLRIDGLALVVAEELRVRSAPGTGADSTILAEPLTKGREVFVVAGPMSANGYLWWQVVAARPTPVTWTVPFGWIAAGGRDGEIWLAPASVACPTDPSIADLAWLGGAGALVCYGGRDLQIRAFRAPVCADGATNVASAIPGWINSVFGGDPLLDREAANFDETAKGIYGRAHPSLVDSGLPACFEDGGRGWFDVTGHFDDPVSSDCRITIDDSDSGGERELEPALTITECRQTFVYTKLHPAPGL